MAADKKKWVSDERFLELISIASAIPGPSSTQVGCRLIYPPRMPAVSNIKQVISSMGFFRAGPLGGLVALVFWMLPAWSVMTVAGIGAKSYLRGRPLPFAGASLIIIDPLTTVLPCR